MSKEMVKNLIDVIPEQDIETIYKVIIKFIPEAEPDLPQGLSEAAVQNHLSG